MKSESAYSNAISVSQSVFNLSGIVKTVNDMLSSVSLTASHASADILAVNLSLANVSGRCYLLENTQNNTILPNLQNLTTWYGYVNSCCTNVSNICSNIISNVGNNTVNINILNTSVINASKTLDSILTDNSSFKSAFNNINSSFTDVNASISSLKQNNTNIINLNSSMINVSTNFWNLSTVTWNLSYLPSYCSNLSTNYWIDHDKLTTAVDNITSVSIVAHNAWDYCVNGFGYINNVSLLNLSTVAWNTSSQLWQMFHHC